MAFAPSCASLSNLGSLNRRLRGGVNASQSAWVVRMNQPTESGATRPACAAESAQRMRLKASIGCPECQGRLTGYASKAIFVGRASLDAVRSHCIVMVALLAVACRDPVGQQKSDKQHAKSQAADRQMEIPAERRLRTSAYYLHQIDLGMAVAKMEQRRGR